MFCCRRVCNENERNQNRIYIIERGPRGPMGPVGPTGPQGPVGPQGGSAIASYGGLYADDTGAVALTTAYQPLALPSQMPVLNQAYGTNAITVTSGGVYEVNYGARGVTTDTSTVTVGVAQNGTILDSAVATKPFTATTPEQIDGTAIVALNAGDVVTLQATATTPTTLTPSDGVNRYLTLKQLS